MTVFEAHALNTLRSYSITHGVTKPDDKCFAKTPTLCGALTGKATTYMPIVTCQECLRKFNITNYP